MTAHEQPAAAGSATPTEDLLQRIVAFEEVHFVVKNAGATAELRGAARVSTGEEWLTIEVIGTPNHLHVRRDAVSRAEFLIGDAKNCGVRFLADEDQPVLTCYLPGTTEHRPRYSPSRRTAFDQIEASHRGVPWRRASEGGS